ncbi:MAG: nucleotidyl transferase AbiEii/AbiGii toxin family protein [Candidatus Micrarchaeota archaeon]|nr:nucleotidyl transferase AbiEii/AbiGii toxin family protein [Candidatus Micrarchaeota archaeon]
MDQKFALKYRRVLDIISDTAACAQNRLILVGGTALAVFYLKHRASVDLDFVPLEGDETKLKEMMKGCLTKKGYRTSTARYHNQFVVQFDDTSIKIEIFYPTNKIKKIQSFDVAGVSISVASLEDIFEMKLEAYANRKAVRDLFDIIFILKHLGMNYDSVKDLLAKYGHPNDPEEIRDYVISEDDYKFFNEVVKNAS